MELATLKELASDADSIFAGLTDDELGQCAEKLEVEEVLAGSTLTRQGDFSYRFFVVLDGQVEVLRDFETLATLGAGQCFGETGVADDAPRNARVVATERSNVASMIGWDFRAMCDAIPTLGDRVQALIDSRSEPSSSTD